MSLTPLIIDLEGLTLSSTDKLLLRHPAVGGVILFSRNYSSSDQLVALTQAIRAQKASLRISVDHEGGRVQRFREGFTVLPAMQVLGDLYEGSVGSDSSFALNLSIIENCGWLMAAELLAHGVDFSYAPVLDLDRSTSRVIGDRAISDKPETCISVSVAFIKGMMQAGMPAIAKHFPGHGGVVEDSHLESPNDRRSFAEIEAHDMRPFTELVSRGLISGIMPSHVIYSQVDCVPPVFSRIWLQDYLRGQLGFNGVIFSDDLSMEGAGCVGGIVDRAEQALAAGCDNILVCNNRDAVNQVIHAIDTGRLNIERCEGVQKTKELLFGGCGNNVDDAIINDVSTNDVSTNDVSTNDVSTYDVSTYDIASLKATERWRVASEQIAVLEM